MVGEVGAYGIDKIIKHGTDVIWPKSQNRSYNCSGNNNTTSVFYSRLAFNFFGKQHWVGSYQGVFDGGQHLFYTVMPYDLSVTRGHTIAERDRTLRKGQQLEDTCHLTKAILSHEMLYLSLSFDFQTS